MTLSETGSETTGKKITSNHRIAMLTYWQSATLLSGLTYYLLTNPSILHTLSTEIRSTFQAESDITFARVGRLPYLRAVIEEGLRIYPPVPFSATKRTGNEGNIIDGQYIPPHVSLLRFSPPPLKTPNRTRSLTFPPPSDRRRRQSMGRPPLPQKLSRSHIFRAGALARRCPVRERQPGRLSALLARATELHREEVR